MNSKIITIKDVVEYLKMKDKTAYALAAKGVLLGFKVEGAWRFRKSDIDQ